MRVEGMCVAAAQSQDAPQRQAEVATAAGQYMQQAVHSGLSPDSGRQQVTRPLSMQAVCVVGQLTTQGCFC